LAAIAKAHLAFSVGLMVLLMVVTIGYMPLVLPLLLEGVAVDPIKIARSLVFLMLIPLAVGLGGKAVSDAGAARLKPLLDLISNVSLILLMVLIWVLNFDKILQMFGTRGILAGILFTVFGYGIGQFLGGPDIDTKRVLALGTAQRNIAAAMVVGGQNFSDSRVVVMVIVVADVAFLILMPLAYTLAKRAKALES
jgi:BASS family bile acid:Na+ symporter